MCLPACCMPHSSLQAQILAQTALFVRQGGISGLLGTAGGRLGSMQPQRWHPAQYKGCKVAAESESHWG